MTKQRLLATDLDGTFIGENAAMNRLWAELDDAAITVAFSTGRHLRSIQAFYDQQQTSRRAAACICMVGTAIWHLVDGEYRLDSDWTKAISASWDRKRVAATVADVTEAVPQPDEWQSEHKASYFLDAAADETLMNLSRRLAHNGLKAKVVYSANRFLDLLPYRSGKGEAVRFLAQTLGVPAESVVTCGDTGNDLDMMRPELGFQSIAVGNAAPELASYQAPRLYHAQAPYARGIREGLVELGWMI